MAEANRISTMLSMVLGAERFPVKVDELALKIFPTVFRRIADQTKSKAKIWTVSMAC